MSSTRRPAGPAPHRLHVEIWSDLTCPWCYLAKRRWESAVRRFEHPGEVHVRHRAFELDPDRAPAERVGALTRLADRFDEGLAQARERAAQVARAGLEEELRFDLERAVHTATFDAHRLCQLGLDQGGPAGQGAVLERLFAAHFLEGRPLDDPDTLQRLGAEAGLDEVQVASVLAGDDYAAQVHEDEALGRGWGVTTVPFAVVNDRLTVVGAQKVDRLVAALQRAWRELGAHPGDQPAAGSVSSSN